MQSIILIAVEKVKVKIKEHNQYNDTSRRIYSEDIKNSIIALGEEFCLSPGRTGKLVGVSEALITKWKKNEKLRSVQSQSLQRKTTNHYQTSIRILYRSRF